jgi:hypothetical protein
MINLTDIVPMDNTVMWFLTVALPQVNISIESLTFKLNILQSIEFRACTFDSFVLEGKYFAYLNGYNWNHLTDTQQFNLYEIHLMMHKNKLVEHQSMIIKYIELNAFRR